MRDGIVVLVASIAALTAWACVHRVASAWEYVAETRASRPTDASSPALDVFDVPEDLLALSMQENESWAQEELLRVIRERYETYRDWNRVRSAMGLGIRT